MNAKILMLAAGVAFGAMGMANAQTAEEQAIIDAQIATAAAICAATPADCLNAVTAAFDALAAAGISGAAFDSAVAGMASTMTEIGANLPPSAQAEIALALVVVQSNAPAGSPLALALAQIVTALETGNGANVRALLPSQN